jgi:hypothetical protein
MSVRIRVPGLLLAAALAALLANLAFGQANQDPCGGRYAGEGLRATFSSQYWDFELDPALPGNPTRILWDSNIINGNSSSYQYTVPGGDCVFLFRNGHVIVGVSWPVDDLGINHGRYVNMLFDYKGPGGCDPVSPPAAFMNRTQVHTEAIQFWTGNGFTPTRQSDGRLLLTSQNALLNFGALTPGMTYYFQLMVKFRIPNDNEEYRFDTQVKVYYGPLDAGGFGWEITPIHEPYDVQLVTKVGKKLVPYGPLTPHESSVYHQEIGSQPSGACYGQFYFPFKLVLERL